MSVGWIILLVVVWNCMIAWIAHGMGRRAGAGDAQEAREREAGAAEDKHLCEAWMRGWNAALAVKADAEKVPASTRGQP